MPAKPQIDDSKPQPLLTGVAGGGNRALLSNAFQSNPVPSLVIDVGLGIRYANDAAARVFGFQERSGRMHLRSTFRHFVGSRALLFCDWLRDSESTKGFELLLYGRELGRYMLFKNNVTIAGVPHFVLNMVPREEFEPLDLDQLITQTIFCYSQLPIYVTDASGAVVEASTGLMNLIGREEWQLSDSKDVIRFDEFQGRYLPGAVLESIRGGQPWSGEVTGRVLSGRRFKAQLTVTSAENVAGGGNNAELYVHILEKVEVESEEGQPLQSVAEQDLTTGMLNRVGFARAFDTVLAEATRTGEPLHVVFVDLDRFPQIDRQFGSALSDRVLTNAALRLKGAVRESDILARLAPLEFVVVLQSDNVGAVASKLVELLAKPYGIDGQIIESAASIGVASYPDDGLNAKELMVRADCAKYASKRKGGNGYTFYADCDQQLRDIFSPLSP
ncbi:diguanylate cyclase (GGDEF)-like protein [Litorivivens lipolytica]|uniref:Diguanylate cyclase (GGDEF)-like protein n=1 Tax=Litorivivens lipolytica TaxID=1524264 RepID=A0A7W4W4T1_9GAMM|nr:diguanylate cyclase (GGDEF)-like protein [Litorivivens lipolytica]